jgi:hypothetical protein
MRHLLACLLTLASAGLASAAHADTIGIFAINLDIKHIGGENLGTISGKVFLDKNTGFFTQAAFDFVPTASGITDTFTTAPVEMQILFNTDQIAPYFVSNQSNLVQLILSLPGTNLIGYDGGDVCSESNDGCGVNGFWGEFTGGSLAADGYVDSGSLKQLGLLNEDNPLPNDPILVDADAPEPSSLVLLGTGLLAILTLLKFRTMSTPLPRSQFVPRRITMRPRTLAFLVLLCLLPLPMKADTTYTYTGHDFTEVQAPYTTSDSVTGWFTVAAPLPEFDFPQDVDPIAFSFSDGVQTITNLNDTSPSDFFVTTDSVGDIRSWIVQLYPNDDMHNANFIQMGNFTDFPSGDRGNLPLPSGDLPLGGDGEVEEVGNWAMSSSISSPSPTPEPSTFALFATGLLGLVQVARRRIA